MAKSETVKSDRVKVGGVKGWKWSNGPATGMVDRVERRPTRHGEKVVLEMTMSGGEKTVLYLPLSHEREATSRVGRVITIEREGAGFEVEYFYSK